MQLTSTCLYVAVSVSGKRTLSCLCSYSRLNWIPR